MIDCSSIMALDLEMEDHLVFGMITFLEHYGSESSSKAKVTVGGIQ